MISTSPVLLEPCDRFADLIQDGHYISASLKYLENSSTDTVVESCPLLSVTSLSSAHEEIIDHYFRLVPKIATVMNRIHGVSFSSRYWESHFGLWFVYWISVCYEKWQRIKVLDADRILCVTKHEKPNLAFQEGFGLVACLDQNFNSVEAYFFSSIAKILGRKIHTSEARSGFVCEQSSFQKNNFRELLRLWKEKLKNSQAIDLLYKTDHVFVSNSLHPPVRRELNRSGIDLVELKNGDPKFKNVTLNKKLRDQFYIINAETEFEQVLITLFPEVIPITLLESYPAVLAYAENRIMPGVYLDSTPWTNHSFQIVAALSREYFGSPLVTIQHGGTTGLDRWLWSEFIERRISDWHLTWGWTDQIYPWAKLSIVQSPQLSECRVLRSDKEKKEGIVLVSTAASPFVFRNSQWSLAEGLFEYFSDQGKFFESLDPVTRSKIAYRGYAAKEYHWKPVEMIEKKAGPLRIENQASFKDLLKKAQLVVLDHNGTALLETLASGCPFICYWKPEYHIPRPSFEPWLRRLNDVGIYFTNPVDAAKHLNQIHNRVDEWWSNPTLKSVIDEFAEYFGCGPSRQSSHRPLSAILKEVQSDFKKSRCL